MDTMRLTQLPTFDEKTGAVNAVIEAQRGSRSKFKYDTHLGLFKLSAVLTEGMVFPFDFGFLPSTLGEDGDPLDVLVLMDEPGFTGCLVPSRLIGVLEAEQIEKGKARRNDRFISVAIESQTHWKVQDLTDLNSRLLDQIEHFFIAYTEMRNKQFKPLHRSGPSQARKLIQEGQVRAQAPRPSED